MTAGREALRWMKRQERRGRWKETGTTRKEEIKGHPGDQAAASDPCCQLLMCSIAALIFMNPSLHWSHLGIRIDILGPGWELRRKKPF